MAFCYLLGKIEEAIVLDQLEANDASAIVNSFFIRWELHHEYKCTYYS